MPGRLPTTFVPDGEYTEESAEPSYKKKLDEMQRWLTIQRAKEQNRSQVRPCDVAADSFDAKLIDDSGMVETEFEEEEKLQRLQSKYDSLKLMNQGFVGRCAALEATITNLRRKLEEYTDLEQQNKRKDAILAELHQKILSLRDQLDYSRHCPDLDEIKSDEEHDERERASHYAETTETELVQSEEAEVVRSTANAFRFADRDKNRETNKSRITCVTPKYGECTQQYEYSDVHEEAQKSRIKFVVPEMMFMRDEHHKAQKIATSRVNARKSSKDVIASYKDWQLIEWIESQENIDPLFGVLMKYRKNMRDSALNGHKFLRLSSSSLNRLGVLPSDTAAFMKCIHNINGQKRKHDKSKPNKRQRRKVRAAARRFCQRRA